MAATLATTDEVDRPGVPPGNEHAVRVDEIADARTFREMAARLRG